MDKLAVFKRDKDLVPFPQCNQIVFYEKQNTWVEKNVMNFNPPQSDTVTGLRQEMKAIELLIHEEKLVACAEISGIPFAVLDQAGHCIFTITDCAEETFDGICQDVAASDERARRKEEMIRNVRPIETDIPGIYELDLITLQKECPEVSSKKALKDFIEQTCFMELKLTCAHVPPWLEHDERLELKTVRRKEAVHVTLTKKQCTS